MQVLVEQLRQKCLEEKMDKNAEVVKAYSALLQSPFEWSVEVSGFSPAYRVQRIAEVTMQDVCSGHLRSLARLLHLPVEWSGELGSSLPSIAVNQP